MLDASAPGSEALTRRLATIRARYPAADPGMVADVVRAVLSTMHGDLSAQDTALLHEVEELGRTIATARAEIAALQVDDIGATHIPSATDELDAIVAHTATATNIILEVCETLDALAGRQDAAGSAVLQDATTKIYEACSFQDITGQRITKVVATLQAIDHKVATIIAAFAQDDGAVVSFAPVMPAAAAAPAVGSAHPPAVGPQLPGSAMDQTDIDKLLASFD